MPDPTLTTTSHLVLGALADGQRTAYALVQHVRRTSRDHWPCGERALYEEPGRLVAAGCATARTSAHGRRPSTTFAITELGRATLGAWLATSPQPTHLVSEGLLRVALADQGTRAQLRGTLSDLCREALVARDLVAEEAARLLTTRSERAHLDALVLRLLADQHEAQATWATRAIGETRAWPATTGVEPTPARAVLAEVAAWLP